MTEELVKLIGFKPALAFIDTFGGCRIYIPHVDKITDDHSIVAVIGIEAATALCMAHGNMTMRVPNLRQDRINSRNQKIIAARRAGASVNNLVMAFGLTYRQIGRICSASKPVRHLSHVKKNHEK